MDEGLAGRGRALVDFSLCVRDSGTSAVACGLLARGGREAGFLALARGLPALRPALVPERPARRHGDHSEKNSDHNHRPGSHRPCVVRAPQGYPRRH